MPLMSTYRLEAFYGDFQALFGIDFEIAPGEIVAHMKTLSLEHDPAR